LLFCPEDWGSRFLRNVGKLVAANDYKAWPPLWSSGQSSWLQIQRPGFDSRHYQK
jgi:hypothetical protein